MGHRDARDLLWLVDGHGPTDLTQLQAAVAALGAALVPVLSPPRRNASSRKEIESCEPETAEGRVTLDPEPDVRETLLLADEFDVDELAALGYIQAACDRDGDVSAAAGAGVLLAERGELLAVLAHALGAALNPPPSLGGSGARALCDGLREVLSPSGGLLATLAEGAEGSRLASSTSASLTWVRDAAGHATEREAAALRDRVACAEAAALVAAVAPAQDAAAVRALLAAAAVAAAPGAPARVLPQLQAAILALLSPGGDTDESVRAAQSRLAADTSLGDAIQRAASSSPVLAPVALAWATLKAPATGPVPQLLRSALRAGGLSSLALSLRGEPTLDAPRATRVAISRASVQIALSVVHGPLGDAVIEVLAAVSEARARAEIEGVLSSDAAVPAAPQRPGEPGAVQDSGQGDSLGALLAALGAALAVSPAALTGDAWAREALGTLLGTRLGGSPALSNSPSTYVAYVRVLADLASSRAGAAIAFEQLRAGNCYEAVSWRRAFELLDALVPRYEAAAAERAPEVNADGSSSSAAPPQLPLACDAAAAAAYLSLLANALRHAPKGEAEARVVALAAEGGSLESVLAVAMSPAPPELKAVAADVLAVAVDSSSGVASHLWPRLLERLTEEVGPTPVLTGGARPAPRAATVTRDMAYQLDQEAARSGDYREQVAIVGAVNAAAAGAHLAGRPAGAAAALAPRAAALARFVLEDVLGSVAQRSFSEPAQRWELAAACLRHATGALQASTAAGAEDDAKAVAHVALESVLGGGGVMRGTRAALHTFPDALAASRARADGDARPRERAVGAALDLLAAALEAERAVGGAPGAPSAVAATLRRDAAELPRLLGWTRYSPEPRLQASALNLALRLEAADFDVASALAAAPPSARGTPTPAALFADGLVSALDAALAPREAAEEAEGDGGGAEDGEGGEETEGADEFPRIPREALLALRLLESGAVGPEWPSLAHVACATSTRALTATIDLASDPALQAAVPQASEAASRALAALAARLESRHQTLDAVGTRLDDLLAAAREPVSAGAARPAAARARLRADASRARLLAQLLADARARPGEAAAARRALLRPTGTEPSLGVSLLRRALRGSIPRPDLLADAEPAAANALRALGIDTWMAAAEMGRADGAGDTSLSTISAEGASAIDLGALRERLLAGYRGWVSERGLAEDAVRAACWWALRHAQRYNTFCADAAARVALVAGWRAALLTAMVLGDGEDVDVALGDGSGSSPLLVGPGGAAEGKTDGIATTLLELALNALREGRGADRGSSAEDAADSAVEAAAALIARAAEVPSGGGATPAPGLLHSTLEELLEAASAVRANCRAPVAVALASYLEMCAGLAPLRGTRRSALGAVLAGAQNAGAAAAAAASESAAAAVATGNAARAARAPLARLAAAAAGGEPGMATLALAALAELLGADTTGGVAVALWEARLPARLLASLREADTDGRRPAADVAACLLARAQLALLARLLLAGPGDARAASARGLLASGALRALTRCRLLDGAALGASAALAEDTEARGARRAAFSVLAPALRVAVGLLAALPAADAACDGVRELLAAHDAVLAAAVRVAAGGGGGDAEAAASLALRALAWTRASAGGARDAPALSEAALLAARACFGRVREGDGNGGGSTLVDWRVGGKGREGHGAGLALRASVAEYLAAAVAAPREALRLHPTRSSAVATNLLALKDALVTVVRDELSTVTSEVPTLLAAARLADATRSRLPAVARATQAVSSSHRALLLAENLLAVLLTHLRSAPPAGSGDENGEDRDYDHLAQLLDPVLRDLEQLLEAIDWANVAPVSALLRPTLKLIEARQWTAPGVAV